MPILKIIFFFLNSLSIFKNKVSTIEILYLIYHFCIRIINQNIYTYKIHISGKRGLCLLNLDLVLNEHHTL